MSDAAALPVVVTPSWVDRDAWPWPPRFVEIEGARMHYVDVGEGPVVLFSHGTPTWSFEWRHLIRALSGRFRCIAVDHLGFGLSDRPAADYRPEAHARRFAAFADALGLRDATLVVHDYGGPIALPLALDRRVARLVIANTWMWSFEDDRAMRLGGAFIGSPIGRFLYGWLNASLRFIAPSAWGDRSKLTPAIQAQYEAPFPDRRGRVDVLWALAKALNGSSAYYRSLWDRRAALADVPTLVVWGLADSAFRPHQLERWRTVLPHAEFVVLRKAGHWPHEEEPDEFADALVAFLDR